VTLRYKLLLLVALTVAVHVLAVARSLIVSRDAVRFIRVAQLLGDTHLFRHALTSEVQHPLFPAAILGVHTLIGPLTGGNTPEGWALSAQITSVLFSVMASVLLFFVARHLLGESAAWIAALLYALLPVKTQIGADALSDMCHLFWSLLALWTAIKGMRQRQLGWIAAAGVSAALAYLTRPEGIVSGLVAVGAVLFPWGLARAHGTRWRVTAAAVLAGMMLVLSVPYMVVIDDFSRKFQRTLAGQYWYPASSHPTAVPTTDAVRYPRVERGEEGTSEADQPAGPPAADRSPRSVLQAGLFAATFDLDNINLRRVLRGCEDFGRDYARSMHFALLPFFVVGLLRVLRGKTRVVRLRSDSARFLGAYMVVQVAIGLALPILSQYLDRRHLVPLVALSSLFSAVGLVEVLAWWPHRPRWLLRWPGRPVKPEAQGSRWAAAVCIALFAVPAVWETSIPLNNSKRHKLETGLYLRAHSKPGERLVSSSVWVGYYADRPFIQTRGPGLDVNKYQLPGYLVETRADWLAILVRYDRMKGADGWREYERTLINGRPRLVHQVPMNRRLADGTNFPVLKLERIFPNVRVPENIQQMVDGSERIRLIETYLWEPPTPLDPAKRIPGAAGSAIDDALVWLARHPGKKGGVFAVEGEDFGRLLEQTKALVDGSPALRGLIVREEGKPLLYVKDIQPTVSFSNGSTLSFSGSYRGVLPLTGRDRIWVPSGLRTDGSRLQRLARDNPTADIRLYYRPKRAVYLYRVDWRGLEKYLAEGVVPES